MAVPFLKGNTRPYCSNAWPGATVSLESERRSAYPDLASGAGRVHKRAIYGGGFVLLDHIVNRYVDKHYDCATL